MLAEHMLAAFTSGEVARVTIAETRFQPGLSISGLGVIQEGGGNPTFGVRIVRQSVLVKCIQRAFDTELKDARR